MSICRRVFAICILLPLAATVQADDGGYKPDSFGEFSHLHNDFKPATTALEEKHFAKAIEQLQVLQRSRANDADVLNLLGFSYRMVKNYSLAEDFYNQALALEPQHKGANEYIGELFLETNRLAAAEERLAVLKKASFFRNKQYRKLKKSIAAYKENQP